MLETRNSAVTGQRVPALGASIRADKFKKRVLLLNADEQSTSAQQIELAASAMPVGFRQIFGFPDYSRDVWERERLRGL